MKTSARTSPVIVPIKGADLLKEYGLTPAEAKNAMKKLPALYAKRKSARKVTRVKGTFNAGSEIHTFTRALASVS